MNRLASDSKVDHLSRREAIDLTIGLGHLAILDDEWSPFSLDYILRHEGRDLPLSMEEKIDALKAKLGPFVGRLATAKSRFMVFEMEDRWQEIASPQAPIVAKGSIEGIESHVVAVRKFYELGSRTKELTPDRPDLWKPGFRTGIVLNTVERVNSPDSVISEAIPPADRVLIPVAVFPGSPEHFNGLWSNQLLGV